MDVGKASNIELEDRIVGVFGRMCADQREFLSLVAEFDRRDAYKVDGARNVSDWLGFRLGVAERTARDWSRAASSLEHLPAVGEAFEDGLLSWDKVRWLTEFAKPDEDASVAKDAIGSSAAEVRRYAMHRKRLSREAADARFDRRYLKIVPDLEEGVVRLWGRLSDADGMLVKKAVERRAEAAVVDPDTERLVPFERRCADALVEVCSLALGADADPDRATVVCHVDAEVLASADGVATIEGMPISVDTARRLLCDGRLQTVVHGSDGQVVGVGRTTRVVPGGLKRTVIARDGGCAWLGCTNSHWLHAHHVIHVAHGGPTNEDNLVTLCAPHHRMTHEGGWRIRGRPGRDLRFIRPDGRPLEAGPRREILGDDAAEAARGP